MKRYASLGLLALLWTSPAWPAAAGNHALEPGGDPAETVSGSLSSQGVAAGPEASASETLRIIAIDPPPGYSLGTAPSSIVVTFNQEVLPDSINPSTMTLCPETWPQCGLYTYTTGNLALVWRGLFSDPFFDDGVVSLISPTQARFDLDGHTLDEAGYRLRLLGDMILQAK